MAKVSIIPWITNKLKRCLGVVQDGDTATQAIGANKYLIWKGNLYKTDSAISIGDTFVGSGSGKNVTAIDDGGFNQKVDNSSFYATEMPISSSDSTKVSTAIANLKDNLGLENALADCDSQSVRIAVTNSNTLNTPYKAGLTNFVNGCSIIGDINTSDNYIQQIYMSNGETRIFVRRKYAGAWQSWQELALKSDSQWKLFDTVVISNNGDASRGITVPTDANEWAIRVEEAAMLLPSANVSVMASGWISIGTYGTATVTGNHSGQNISISFRKTSDGSAIFGGRNMYVYYR